VTVPASNDTTNDPNISDWTGTFYISNGVQLTGLETRKVTKMYVDDKPDFGGITVEVDYRKRLANNTDGDLTGAGEYQTAGVAKRKTIPLALDKVDWKVIPYYNNGSKTGEGGIYVTIGRNTLLPNDALLNPNKDQNGDEHKFVLGDNLQGSNTDGWKLDYGVAAISPLDEIWHVTGLELEKEPELDPFFYWQEDTSAKWLERVRDTARIKVTYSNGGTKSFSIPEAVYQNTVWLNGGYGTSLERYRGTNAGYGWDDGTYNEDLTPIVGPNDGYGDIDNPIDSKQNNQLATWIPFGMEGVLRTARLQGEKAANLVYTKIRTPQIGFYYRGARCWLDKPVFTNFVRVDAEIISGNDSITVDMRLRDNDYYGMDMEEFAKLINVSAVYQAYGTDLEAPFALKFKKAYSNSENDSTSGAIAQSGANPTFSRNVYTDKAWQYFYTMNFGVRALRDEDSWGIASQVKNNGSKAVTVYYNSPEGEDVQAINSNPAAAPIRGRLRRATVPVNWTNVPGYLDFTPTP